MDKRNWKLVYSNYTGAEKKAVELIYQEMGALILRDPGVYVYHVLPCEPVSKAVIDKNAVVIGVYSENELIRKYIDRAEIPEDGYVVKVMDNPQVDGCQLVLITANKPREVFYGAADFVDDYFVKATPDRSGLQYAEIFEKKLPEYYHASAPFIKTRSIFTWGHSFNDYESYIANMARLKLNTLILWNDFVPINIADIINEAHTYGIAVYLGYSWGWNEARKLDISDEDTLKCLQNAAIQEYEETYSKLDVDGIYFQSFTEFKEEYIGEKLIAEVVTDFVNETAGKLLQMHPGLVIQFGLHASSVKERLDIMKKVDERICIIWEDCGSFPYHYLAYPESETDFENTMKFTEEMLTMRKKNSGDGVLYKGLMVMDWNHFVHQSGPFVMGRMNDKTIRNDIELLKPAWRKYQSEWIQNGIYAYKMTNHIAKICDGDIMIGMAAQLAGGIWFSEALCAQILWEGNKPYQEILNKVSRRASVDIV